LAVAGVLSALLLGLLGWQVRDAFHERADAARIAEARAAAASGSVDRTLRLLSAVDAKRARPVRTLLLAALVAELDAAASRAPGDPVLAAAHRRADELIAAHGAAWPALLRALEPVAAGLRAKHEIARLLDPVRVASADAAIGLDELDSILRAGEREARRLGDEAAREFSRAVEPVWLARLVVEARAEVRAGRPAAAVAILERTGPIPWVVAVVAGEAPHVREGGRAAGTPAERLFALEEALRLRDLEALRRGVRVRPDATWPADAAARLEDELPRTCRALASLAAESAASAAEPGDRLGLLLEAVTCDEVLPPPFVEQARAAIAWERVAWAEAGGRLPSPSELLGDEHLLARLACAADEAGRPDLVRAALRGLEGPDALAAGLGCGRWEAPMPERARPAWPRLDYPWDSVGAGEEHP
jgi:hypothetical protein